MGDPNLFPNLFEINRSPPKQNECNHYGGGVSRTWVIFHCHNIYEILKAKDLKEKQVIFVGSSLNLPPKISGQTHPQTSLYTTIVCSNFCKV